MWWPCGLWPIGRRSKENSRPKIRKTHLIAVMERRACLQRKKLLKNQIPNQMIGKTRNHGTANHNHSQCAVEHERNQSCALCGCLLLALTLITGVLYPLLVTVIGQIIFPSSQKRIDRLLFNQR